MGRILKYELPNSGEAKVMMPGGARVLSVAYQHQTLWMWVLAVEAWVELEANFFVALTGADLPDEAGEWKLIGRAATDESVARFVVHVFEVARRG